MLYALVQGIQVHRTSNFLTAEISRCVEFFNMGLGWFDCIEPTSLQGKQGPLNLETSSVLGVYVQFFNMSSGWFDCTEPS